jgi:hypothetical protein
MSLTGQSTSSAPTKGQRGGLCARTVCHNPAENFFHPALGWFYCGSCARRVNEVCGQCVIAPLPESQP